MDNLEIEKDDFHKVIRSDSDPQIFEGNGEEVEVLFHSQDQDRIPPDMPRVFVVTSDPKHPEFNRFEEKGDDLMHPIILLHRKDKPISPQNFFEPDAIKAKNKVRLVVATAGIVATASAVTWLIVKTRKK